MKVKGRGGWGHLIMSVNQNFQPLSTEAGQRDDYITITIL